MSKLYRRVMDRKTDSWQEKSYFLFYFHVA